MWDCDDFSLLYGKEILVYGTGSIARNILPYLYAMQDCVRILGIALSHAEKEREYQTTGLKIQSIYDWANRYPQATVLIATSDTYHSEIAEICTHAGFQEIVPVTPILKDSITYTFFKQYLQKKHIDLDKPYIKLGSAQYINPLQSRLRNSANIFAQLSDIVFPHIFSDWTLLNEGPYDPEGILALPIGGTVLDCGANFGTFSSYAASKGCRCYAFEPTPELQSVLQEYAALYAGRIIPIESALSDQDGVSVLHLSSYSCGANSLLNRVQSARDITVSTVTIDSFVENNQLSSVDFIKADIEGAERLMLDGAKRTLKKFAPKLSLCTYHFPDDKKVLEEKIKTYNPKYHVIHKWEKLYAWVEEND